MPRAKAPFKGGGAGSQVRDFSADLRSQLRNHFPDIGNGAELNQAADDFVSAILNEAAWASAQMHWNAFESTKQELRAERQAVAETLTRARDQLQSLSPDFDRLLGIDVDPPQLATQLSAMLVAVDAAELMIDSLPQALKPRDKQHAIALEMAIRVLRVLKEHGIPAVVRGDSDTGQASPAVMVLKLIGDDIGLCLALPTWRDKVAAARVSAPDLLK